MGSLGTYLRELRSAKDVSLDEVMRATRVGRAHLEALEAEDLASLPAPVFVKGFIRAYCEFLQADPGEALARYRELIGERSRMPRRPALRSRARRVSGAGPSSSASSSSSSSAPPLHPELRTQLVLPLGAATGRERACGTGSGADRAGRSTPARQPPRLSRSLPRPPPRRPAAPPAALPLPVAAPAVARGIRARTPPRPGPRSGSSSRRWSPRGSASRWTAAAPSRSCCPRAPRGSGARRNASSSPSAMRAGISLELNGRALPPVGAPGAVIRELVLPADGG